MAYIDKFTELYNQSPSKLKAVIDTTEFALQDPHWHPEGNTKVHIKLVTNRLHNKYNDINLDLAGLFHDLGKVETTKWDGNTWKAIGHEDVSIMILKEFKDWVINLGGNFDLILFIVEKHMLIKFLDNFRTTKKIDFVEHKYFDYVLKFNSCDFGGLSLSANPIKDMTIIHNNIKVLKNNIRDKKIISSKINGSIIMDKYPNLKGEILGKAMVGFKNYILTKFKIHATSYILDNTSDNIFKEFDIYLKGDF